MIKVVSIFGAIICIIILSLLFYQWNQKRSYEDTIKHIFSEEVTSIVLRSRYNSIPMFKIKEQQKIMMIKAWLLNARGIKSFNLVPYPDALDQLIIIHSNDSNSTIKISPPGPYSIVQYKNYEMVSPPLPDVIKEVKLWKKAYKMRRNEFLKRIGHPTLKP